MTRGDHDGTDAALRRLLEEAVADVQPHDRLIEIRRRTRQRARPRRRWLAVVTGAGVATAAVVGGAVLIGQLGPDDQGSPPVARATPTRATPVYFVGDAPGGPRLYREFQALPAASGTEALTEALARLEADGGPDDPDYRTVWPAGSFAGVEVADGRVVVTLDRPALQRPARVSRGQARLGIQQVVYTADAGLGEALPVSFQYDGTDATRVLGRAVSGPVPRAPQDEVVAPVNISDPSEGSAVDADYLVARGTVTSASRRVDWLLQTLDPAAGSDVITGHTRARPVEDGSAVEGGRLQWEVRIDVTGLGPGSYLLTAQTHPEGGNVLTGVATDTRTFVVR
ncbi:MAG TPA: GerMN domain-containing protein [Nocardioides sp.]|nr:GerMN domain-containing protein [Nocardioides sp.]